MFDVAVIGAGMAGLVCAQQLRLAGYQVVVVEKSRGLGGRVATRRLYDTCADHGTCYLKPKGELFKRFVQSLCDRGILQVWTDTVHELKQTNKSEFLYPSCSVPSYVASMGMSAIAKYLATDLEIRLNQRVEAMTLNSENSCWHLTASTSSNPTDSNRSQITAKAVVVAIPAPQALMLLEPLSENGLPKVFCDRLRSVEFDPCLSVIAGYPSKQHQAPDEWKAVTFIDNSDLAWVGFDSSKRLEASQFHVFVLQSRAAFARCYLENQDLQPMGYQLLAQAAQYLLPWLDKPEWMQVHRWRYAFPSHPWQGSYLSAETSPPLICCGDWCGSHSVEGAMHSGLAAEQQINHQLEQRSLPGDRWF